MLKHLTATALVMLTLSACSSSASLVRKDAIGGRVRLVGAYMPAMSDARMLMVEHCNGRFEMVEREDALEFRCKAASPQPVANRTKLALEATASVH
jgi:hypothetical protein